MSTTIDSLSIEIQSSSTNASQGIKELAESLKELKKSGTVTVAIKNLNNLSSALKNFTDASNATRSVGKLVGSLSRLKEIGSVSNVGNGIAKLSSSLKTLDTVNVDGLAPQIKKIAEAVAPLSSIKTGGIGTMVNALAKLDKVTASLSDDNIEAFAEKVKKLNTVLEPLSAKMTTIQAGLRGVNSRARSAGSSIRSLGEDVNGASINFSSFIYSLQEVVGWFQQAIQKFSEFMAEAIEWDGIAARFGRGFGSQAQEVYDWIVRLNEEMGINIQQFMKYSSVYATMLTGFGVANEDAGKMALGYTELTYDIWAGYNDIYKTFDEAAEAVKSAIAGEVEPVRRAGFTIIESTLQQTAANHGLEISLANATEAQKSYLRYLTLVDQAHAQNLVGTYAKELNTAEGLTRTLSQQLKSLTQAFGSLFLPVLVKIVPWLQAFVELLTEAVHWVAALFGVEIQAVDWSSFNAGSSAIGGVADSATDATDALGSAAKAAKELKNATLGIDELNVISPPSSAAGSGGGGGAGGGGGFGDLDVDSLWDESIFDSVQSQVDKIKEKIKDLLPIVGGVATALAGWNILKFLDNLDDADVKIGKLKPKLEGLGKGLAVAGISIVVGKLVWDFTGAYLEGGSEADLLKALGTTTLGVALAGWLAGKPGAAFTLLVSGTVMLSRLFVEISEGTVEWDDPEAVTTLLIGGLETAIGAIFTWKTLKPIIGPAIKNLIPSITTALSGALAGIGPALAAAAPYAAIGAAIVGVIALAIVDYDFTEIGRKIGEKIGSTLRGFGEWVKEIAPIIGDGFKAAFEWVKDNFEIDSIGELISFIFNPVKLFDLIMPELLKLGEKVLDWIEEKIENLKGNINEFFGGFFDGLFDGLGIDMSWAEDFEIQYTDIIEGVVNPISVPIKLAKSGWKSIKDWIGGIPVVQQGVSLIKSKWESVRKWVGNIPTLSQGIALLKSKWSSVKSWIGNIPVLKQGIGLIKNGWSSVKSWIGSMPTLGAKIKLLKNGWKSVKDWLGNLNFDLKFKLPKIGVNWSTKEVLGFKIKYPSSFYTYAKGGFPDMGEFFVAREAGPEMVGKIGGRSAVVNNDQIVDGISEGVYAAVMAAIKAANSEGGQAVNVYLDGKLIARNVEKHQKERGATIMGTQVYSY